MKRKDVLAYLRSQNCNIYFLQETHIKTEAENFLRSAWGYNVWVAGKETNKNGVAILFNNNFMYKMHNVIRDDNGCYIIMDVELNDIRVTLVNIYGPSSGDHPEFFDEVMGKVQTIGNDLLIMGGDWNVLLNTKLDARNYVSGVNRPKSRLKIKDLMLRHELIDVWRELNPEKRRYTWRRFNTVKQGRLDYFLVSENLMNRLNGVNIGSSYRSDHSPVYISLKSEEKPRGKPYWKFNNSLLRDKEYVDIIKKVILDIKKQYAKIDDLDGIENILNWDLHLEINDQLFLEVLLT